MTWHIVGSRIPLAQNNIRHASNKMLVTAIFVKRKAYYIHEFGKRIQIRSSNPATVNKIRRVCSRQRKVKTDIHHMVPKDSYHYCNSNIHLGRAIAQAVSRWLPTAAARV
jgi:hypothetical protein